MISELKSYHNINIDNTPTRDIEFLVDLLGNHDIVKTNINTRKKSLNLEVEI